MQTIEKTDSTQLSKFTSLVYLYSGLGIAFWLLCAAALTKYFMVHEALMLSLLQTANHHPFLSGVAIIAVSLVFIMLCRAFVDRSYFLTFVFYLGFIATFSVLGVPIFVLYSASAIVKSVALTAVIFVALAAYGYFTKTNLMTWQKTLFWGLIAILAASLVNVFLLHNSFMGMVVNILTIIVFMGYIAFDSQNLKYLYAENKDSNLGALALYASVDLILDFINILLSILSLGNDNN
ncbi:Bax inhibitor-1/YccA family protein [Bombilactobacillus thymidiniphilus]|uniref:Bax inhibitor-1 family protein n=1 Tax=Bombilactobacillus thymidiniphilus TaxID=2923363 RepID=A0ABY4PBM0_9LACO|nr:Bax inhibitor-1 family protein [Bombilactobacillus thymidiniphilus]UQS82995.1 Bax inhibitor-1 family protein [Bombilactobacillus thymidiniphilus]